MNDRIIKTAFCIFIIGLCSLIIGAIYEQRFELINSLKTIYIEIVSISLFEKVGLCIFTITMFSFFVFILSISSKEVGICSEEKERGEQNK